MNPVGFETGNASITSGRDIPWLQDVDSDGDGTTDVWLTAWPYVYRDVVLVDENNEVQDVYNLTQHDLSEAENYGELKQKFLDVADFNPSSRWQCPIEPLDVNNSSQISPIDALLVINELGKYEGGILPQSGEVTNFVDTNGDGAVGPLDALLVINQLNVIAANAAAAPMAAMSDASQAIIAEAPLETDLWDASSQTPLGALTLGVSVVGSESTWTLPENREGSDEGIQRTSRSDRYVATTDLIHPLSQLSAQVLDQVFGSLADAI